MLIILNEYIRKQPIGRFQGNKEENLLLQFVGGRGHSACETMLDLAREFELFIINANINMQPVRRKFTTYCKHGALISPEGGFSIVAQVESTDRRIPDVSSSTSKQFDLIMQGSFSSTYFMRTRANTTCSK